MFSFSRIIFTYVLCLAFMLGTSVCVFAGMGNWPPPASTLTPAYAPKVDIGPGSNGNAVLLQVGNTEGDQSTIWRQIPIGNYKHIEVSFDIYRYKTDTYYGQNLWWWVGNSPGSIPGNPALGLQWDGGYQNPAYRTYPAGFNSFSTPTIFDAYANITMKWDFVNSTFSSTYNGVTVCNNVSFSPFINRNDFSGFGIRLLHDTPTGVGGPSRVWIDNFRISDDLIYDAGGFTNVTLGELNNQQGWVATGASGPVPEYFSHFDTTAGAWWTGIALANPNRDAVNVAVTAYSQSGTEIGNSIITLPPNGQKAFQATDQLGVSGTGWIQIVPDNPIIGLEIFGNIASGSLAGLSSSRKPTNKFSFSHFDTTTGWWTGIALANPHSTQASVTLTAYDQSGIPIGSGAITLPANGQKSFLVKDQFGVSGTGWIKVVSDQTVVGLEIFGENHTGQITGVQASTDPSTILYVPHFDTTAAWWTGMALANPNSSSANVTVTAYSQSGTQIGNSIITLPANGQKVFMVKDQLGVSSIGWLYVSSDQPIVGLEILGSVTSGGLAGLVAPNTVKNNLAFSHFDTSAEWWTGIALANPHGSLTGAILTVYDQSGTMISDSTIALPPYGQKFFQLKDQMNVRGTGWINVVSGQPIVGLEIFGNVTSGQITGIGSVSP